MQVSFLLWKTGPLYGDWQVKKYYMPKLDYISALGQRALFLGLLLLGMLASTALMAQANIQGQWSTLPFLMPINPIHVTLMPTGKVLIIAGSGNCPPSQTGCPTGAPYGPSNNSGAAIYDPVAETITQFSLSVDLFCDGMVLLPDGRALINGGNLQYDPFEGLRQASIFDPATSQITSAQNMAHGRWYPTLTTLGNGQVMTFSGLDENGNTNTTVEIYTVGSGWSGEQFPNWTPPLYPWLHLLPNGNVFYSGASPSSALYNPSTATWTQNVATTNYGGLRTYGSSVLLPLTPANNYDPKVMIFGGDNPATATTEIIDLGAPAPTWQYGPSMSEPRIEMDAVLLPDGNILAMGGSAYDEVESAASLNADLYNPATNTFSSAGANAFARLYHTVALLLPDATVWLAGGNPERGTFEPHMEIYQPPYLFQPNGTLATRPSVSGAPISINCGSPFTVQTPDAANIASVVLMRMSSSTHAFNMDQRMVGLSFAPGSGTLNVTAPPNSNIAPPGYYMLFILNTSGVPSEAAVLRMTCGSGGGGGGGGSLSGSLATPSGTQNLTSLGTLDWAHWGLTTAASFDHNASVTQQISNFRLVGTGPANQYGNNTFGYSWTNGTPTGSATNSTTGLYVAGAGNGFTITAPADTTPRTLTVYVGTYGGQGQLVAHLSDGSSADYVDSTLNNATGQAQGAYTFTYKAASSGQTLSVTFTDITSGVGYSNVNLQAATLAPANQIPNFTLSAAPSTQSVAAGGSTTYTITVTPSGGFSGAVGFSASGLPTGATASFSPVTVSGSGSTTMTVTTASGTPASTYPLTITGSSGALSGSATANLTVTSGSGGSLSGSLATPSGTQNLTSLGTLDWAHWGLTTAASFDHNASVTQQISNFTIVGTGPANQYGNNAFGYSWTNGTPTGSVTNSTTGIYIQGVGNGFTITAPADTTPRTLTVYVGTYNAQGRLVASLSDGSAANYVDSTINSGSNSSAQGAYTFTYQAASSGQTLSVTFTDITNNGAYTNVTLQAATLN